MLTAVNSFELSPQQKYLWSLQQDNSFVYCAVCAVSITGNLQTEVLKAAINQVVGTYEILRTNYRDMPEMNLPLQFINDRSAFWHQDYDLSSESYQDQEEKLENIFNNFCNLEFNLREGAVLNLSLAKLATNKYILLVALPALCADRLTLHNFIKQVSNLYTSIYHQEEVLDSEVLQYADLSAWQNELLIAEETQAGRDFWSNIDFSALAALQLPFENTAAASLPFNPQSYCLKLDIDFQDKITNYAQAHNIALSDVLFTCWNILLWRLTGQDNLITGIATNGRKYQELESVLGLLSKSLPISIHIQETDTFGKLWQKVKINLDTASTYEEYFSLEREAEFLPFTFEFEPQLPQYDAVEVKFSIHQQTVYIDRYKIKLSSYYQDNSLYLKLCYDANLFSVDDIQRLTQQFCTLLESAIAFPNLPVSQLEVLDKTEKQKLLQTFNDTQVNYDRNQCIHHLFAERVINTPDKIALIFENETFTYTQLNNRANQIARYLQKLGIGAEILVGLCVDRSPLMVLGILAILKAGGAYLPLDPTYPQERLAFMLQNSQPKVLLTQEHLKAELPAHETQVICIDQIGHIISQESTEDLTKSASTSNLAYVIYTSGSTGKPKGVRVTHANLCHYVQAMQQALGITADDVYLHTASLAFSSSVRQLMVPLTRGATVKIATQEQRQDPLTLFQGIKQDNITVIDIVPSFWRNCNYTLASLAPESKSYWLDNKLRLIVSASEPLLSDIPINWKFGLQHQTYLINMFGQTETCGIVATYPITIEADAPTKVIPLGKPIANTQIYLLDQHLQPVPIGVAGELYIGGWGVGQGYLHRPDLTAERFIPNPLSHELGARLYKTGDLGRYLPDGTIEFIGRSDYQVKIRGFRIELAEIEAILTHYPQVREAVVVMRESETGDKRLIAYLVPANSEAIDLNALNKFLQDNLPNYMLPSNFAILEALPLTPNGKVNRQALPAPEELSQQIKSAITVPRTPVEEVLAGIWAKILSVKQVGIEENFFELGGHSLLATQVMSQIREAFQLELPLRSLFESPTVAELAQCVEATLREGQQLAVLPIEKVTQEDNLPLSFAQQRLWFLDQLQPGSSAYNLSRAIQIKGELNIAALEQSFNEIIRRHEALRTTFVSGNGEPQQIINPEVSITLPVVNLQDLTPEHREIETKRRAIIQAQRSFNLTKTPLLNVVLLQLAEQEYILLFTIHHIVADGWSAGIIIKELAAFYESFCTGKSCELASLPIQYVDFAVWQRTWLQKEVLASQMEYWKQQLSGDLPVLELPIAKPRPKQQTFAGKKQKFMLSPALTNALKALSQKQGVTLFMTLLAAFKTLLYRYSGQADILVGSPIANRNRSEIEGLIGFFVNTVVLRTKLEENSSFINLLKQVREITLGAYTHQDLPFELLVEELQPQRSLSHTPVFQVMFALQNMPGDGLKLSGLNLEYLPIENDTARFDLSLSFTDNVEGLVGELEYNSDLFDADSIKSMLRHLTTLLVDIVEHPDKSISELSILTPAEQQQILREWNYTEADYPHVCVHELFSAQVAKTPDAIAVIAGSQQLTYKELDEKANQLAHYLSSLGVAREVLVGICCDRSLPMIVALLAILKAGGAYIPLDPTFPQERLAYMLQDSQTSVLLTQQHLLPNLPPHYAQVICLDSNWESIAIQEINTSNSNIEPDNLMYTIYTSGSTGKPKGVQITHRNVVNFLTSMQQGLHLSHQDSLFSVTTLSFDIAVLEIFLPLIVGAKVILTSREIATDGAQLLQQLNNSAATVMQATPATWRMLLDAGWEGNSQLKILCGGEALPQSLARQLCQRCSQIWNLYGPTETTIWSTIYQISDSEKTVSIGRPLANTQIYILDKYLQPVPVGISGEIYIGGVGLARGYFNQPELTKEKFITNPFNPKTLLYKTGDLARYLPNGEIEYLERIDYQVKLRGFRIELGEIEAVLEQYPAVYQCVVMVREDGSENQRLVAYLVAENAVTDELRQYLRQQLPEYMIPNAFMFLAEIPLTPNGKVNRRALPTPENTHLETSNFVAPRHPIEEVLAGIWTQVLGVNQLGIHDNFFELGGHSLLATQVISRIAKTLGVNIPLQSLFEFSTIAELAKNIQEASHQGVSAITPVPRNENLPLSFAQARLWLLEQINPDSGIYNMPAAVHLVGELNVDALEESINEIIRRHEILRTTFTLIDGEPLQIIVPNVQLKIPVVNLQKLSEAERKAEIQRLSVEEFQYSFDFTQAPLLRCTLLQLGEQEHILLFTIHHIVFDGWSTGVLIRELAALYTAFAAGKASPLPKLPIQYADFAVWQRQHLQGERREALLTYWKQQLANVPILQLPTTRPRAEVKTNRGASHTFVIPASVVQEVRQLAQQEGVTLFMTLLASFKILLQRYSSQDDIVVGTDVANRNQAEIEPLIGFFINLLVLRTDLSTNPTFLELLQRVRTQTLSAYAHQDLPFDELVRELQPERHLSNTVPLFQVLFVLQNTPTSALELPGLNLKLLELETKNSRFDLALFLTETEQGIEGKWQYNADLFAADTITIITNSWKTLINSIIHQPESHINTLEMLTEADKAQQTMQQQERKAAKRQKFMSIAPKAVSLIAEQLIKTNYLQAGQNFPLVIQPNTTEVDLLSWVENNREYIETELLKHGAILFRDFNIKSVSEFENFAQTICPNLFAEYGDLPRTGEGGNVYGSTPYPADKAILFHNESSHLHQWPLKIWFFCVQPAQQGGETPIIDCRKAYRLINPKLRERLEQKQLMYVRHYTNSLDVSWQKFFRTNDKFVVENYCRQAKIDIEWYDNNSLITRQVRPALAVHPKTSELVFFNQIQLHHIAYLDEEVRKSLLSTFGEQQLPRNVYYGDGTSIENSVIAEINEVYQQSQTSFPWEQGDILMLDNMLTAHGRNPYVGSRKIVVAMGEMIKEMLS
ncbi:MAG: non-ribosomal peptide synthetase [Nostoc sp. EfeVER01]|uniref:non-ribosomal peptide synthetase n=1 Tax=unclassified Nostoc TaxID=2593658 RepID=UPI002AD36BC5|nr:MULTISPECIES: non-ribosomal peptide synthetase [unclassified Nostoc]MDZ7945771.1 amino acid adenylation domain-containing protein [Nostoc sp. EfeVER01]MDZ7994279.1 amino acid adenylation domain-containing protein [Nostoc sp. EspVER01]